MKANKTLLVVSKLLLHQSVNVLIKSTFKVSQDAKLKDDLQNLYSTWRRFGNSNQWEFLEDLVNRTTRYYLRKIETMKNKNQNEIQQCQRKILENSKKKFFSKSKPIYPSKIRVLKQEYEKIERYERELQQKAASIRRRIATNHEVQRIQQQIVNRQHIFRQRNLQHEVHNQQRGLTSGRIQQFHQFPADESLVGDRCGVCLDDIEVGRRMMRLDCDGQHTFHQECVEGWFDEHKTCPNCRHVFH